MTEPEAQKRLDKFPAVDFWDEAGRMRTGTFIGLDEKTGIVTVKTKDGELHHIKKIR